MKGRKIVQIPFPFGTKINLMIEKMRTASLWYGLGPCCLERFSKDKRVNAQIREQILVPDLYVFIVESVAFFHVFVVKKTSFEKIDVQVFCADATM